MEPVVIAVFSIITLVLVVWLWTPVMAVVNGINHIGVVVVRGVFILPNLVITLSRVLWTLFITPLEILWTYPLHETILRVFEVLVWIFVGGGLIIATNPELIVKARWIFTFLRESGPQFSQRTVAIISKGAPFMYRAAIQLPTKVLQAILDFFYILPDITTLETIEEDNAPPTIHITDPTDENNTPVAATRPADLTDAPPFMTGSPNSQTRNQAEVPTVVRRNLPDLPMEARDGTELRAHPSLVHVETINALFQDDAFGSMDGHETLPTYIAVEDAPPPFGSPAGTIRR